MTGLCKGLTASCAAASFAVCAATTAASFHLWQIDQIYFPSTPSTGQHSTQNQKSLVTTQGFADLSLVTAGQLPSP